MNTGVLRPEAATLLLAVLFLGMSLVDRVQFLLKGERGVQLVPAEAQEPVGFVGNFEHDVNQVVEPATPVVRLLGLILVVLALTLHVERCMGWL